ncbi:coiled-coil domain-containing protein 191 [Aricia agestis]|uniref:coiled-coil domain-containing protein 191 n=1 Tax=Aricia agestis TaxID=91739 RepID=UPI001C20C177|nr:coiled-coil domain-containing protein 191 [Aricia agestis]
MRRHEYLATKYVQRWKAFVHRRSKGILKQTRRDTVDNFLDKLRKKKCTRSGRDIGEDESRDCRTMPVRDFRTYQHRYLVQKHIIAMQKAKLEEQNKVIEELKLKKIAHDSSESLVRMKEEIRKTYFEMDRKLKPKLQCMSKELKIKEFEEPTMVLNCLKVPQFLKRMEARAREREERHAVTRERRRQQDEERARIKHQEELERAEMDRGEKNRRIKLLQEKRRREKIENIRKKEHAERTRALRVMAELHHERSLMAAYGIRPLRLLVEMRRRSEDAARAHHLRQTTSNYFLRWMWHTQDMCFERNHKADELYRRRLLTRAFSRFKELHRASVLKRQVAEDYSDLVVSRVVFRALRAAVVASRADRASRWRRAVAYYDGNLLFKTFTSWRALPALNALRREQEARKSKWRQKVLLVVPDYTPPDE